MLGLKFCNWCEKTLWWWKEKNKVKLDCMDGALELHLCDECWKIFEEFNKHIEEVRAKREEDETL